MSKEDVSITYENNIFYCTKNKTKWISVDGKKWYGEEKRITDLENKIADIKANCDLAIEGRDIKIKELEQELTVQKDQLQEEINLHLHAEDYIKSLEKENAELKADNDARKFAMAMGEKVEKQLREENAELKEKVNILDNCDRLGDVITEAYKDRFTKAIELLNKAILTIEELESGYDESKWVRGDNFCEEVKQFIKEIEK